MSTEDEQADQDEADDFGLGFVARTVTTVLYLAFWIVVGSLVLFGIAAFLDSN